VDFSVVTRNLSKGYDKWTLAVDSLSVWIRAGEIFGLLGPNGAGKTTTIRMLLGLLKPTSGQAFIHGEQISTGRQKIKARLGVCPQETVLWPELTVSEHLHFLGKMYDVDSRTVRTNADHLIRGLGLEEKRNEQARKLSGGLKRRLNLALALIHDPDVVLLDEPSAGLDPQSRALLWERIAELSKDKQKTIILTTHSMEEADRLSDRVGILDHGKMLVLDTPENLKKSIGEGDALDIEMKNPPSETLVASVKQATAAKEVSVYENTLTIRALNIMEKFPRIIEVFSSHGLALRNTRLRPNTLEDVFLKLTGRSLRDA
jgi:ABC-2 type transport system ATP-binding protein